jgi:hypothetical protein
MAEQARRLSPRDLRIETLELRVALGGRSSETARKELEALLAENVSVNGIESGEKDED